MLFLNHNLQRMHVCILVWITPFQSCYIDRYILLLMQVGKNDTMKYIFQQEGPVESSSDHDNEPLCFLKGRQSNFSRTLLHGVVSLFQHTVNSTCLLAQNLKSNCQL
jgi:hypothetical protein